MFFNFTKNVFVTIMLFNISQEYLLKMGAYALQNIKLIRRATIYFHVLVEKICSVASLVNGHHAHIQCHL